MDWDEYKRLCDQPQVMSRHLLERSAEILQQAGDQSMASKLQGACNRAPLERPRDHRGDARSHMFLVRFSAADTDRILRALRVAEASGINALQAAWAEYRTCPACSDAS